MERISKPSYKFMELLEIIDRIQEWYDLQILMDVIHIDQYCYTGAQKAAIGTKLKERFITIQHGRNSF